MFKINRQLFRHASIVTIVATIYVTLPPICTAIVDLSSNVYLQGSEEAFFQNVTKLNYDIDVNVTNILSNYYSVCPSDGDQRFPECPPCTLGYDCIRDNSCCPYLIYGYLSVNDVNVAVYPRNRTFVYKMISKCPPTHEDGNTTQQCSSYTSPCTSKMSQVIYRNPSCAACHSYDTGECEVWPIGFDCNKTINAHRAGDLTSFEDLEKMVHKYNCGVSYKRPNKIAEEPMLTSNGDRLIDKCNVSGYWNYFDADINWACIHYNRRYKEFKNVFCYICNPSAANVHNSTNDFPITCDLKPEHASLTNLCSSSKNTSRFYPIRNVFCKKCSESTDGKWHFVYDAFEIEVIEAVATEDSISSKLNFLVSFNSSANNTSIESAIIFFDTFLMDFVQETQANQRPMNTSTNNILYRDIGQIPDIYSSVCGIGQTCLSSRNSGYWNNPVCGQCSCHSSCFELGTCCAILYLSGDFLSCYGNEAFLAYTRRDNSRKSEKISHTNSTYKILSKCVQNVDSDNSRFSILTSLPSEHPFLSIPLLTREDFVYENAWVYLCYMSSSPISINFQFYCDTLIEISLLRTFEDIIAIAKKYCHTLSFVPLNGSSCMQAYDSASAAHTVGPRYERVHQHPSTFPATREIWYLGKLSSLTKAIKEVYARCNKTGLWEGHEYETHIIDICERQDVSALMLPEYEYELKVYKNFACFLCNPDTQPVPKGEVISTCNRTTVWYEPNSYLEDMCVNGPYSPRFSPYKNVYCSECNLPPLQKVIVRWEIADTDNEEPTLRYLFRLSVDDIWAYLEYTKDQSSKDSTEENYVCTYNFKVIDGVCRPELDTVTNTRYYLPMIMTLSDRHAPYIHNNSETYSTPVDLTTICFELREAVYEHVGNCDYDIYILHCSTDIPCTTQSFHFVYSHGFWSDRSLKTAIDRDGRIYIDIRLNIKRCVNVTALHERLVRLLNVRFDFVSDTSSNTSQRNVTMISQYHDTPFESPSYDMTTCTYFYKKTDKYFQPQATRTVDKYLLCPQIEFHINDTEVDNQTHALITADGLRFTSDEYKVIGGNYRVCNKTFVSKQKLVVKNRNQKSYVPLLYDIMQSVCAYLSLSCLFLTFMTYCIFKELRTLPGQSLMTLVAFMFIANIIMQHGLFQVKQREFCVVIGILIHFTWLASFSAMNVCAFHMFRLFVTYHTSTSILDKDLRSRYLMYICGLPLSLVSLAVISNLVISSGFDIGYGTSICFLANIFVVIGTFWIPAAVLFLSNIILFASAFHKIRTAPDVRSNVERRDLIIYIRMCTLIGITWPLQIVDGQIEFSWFSFLVTALNLLQGAFIFVSFVCNKRVFHLIKARFTKPNDFQ